MVNVTLGRSSFFFFFNDTATTEIYTLSLHDALPISASLRPAGRWLTLEPSEGRSWCRVRSACRRTRGSRQAARGRSRSEEHTSELQSQSNLVCRLLLEKKKTAPNLVMPHSIQHSQPR